MSLPFNGQSLAFPYHTLSDGTQTVSIGAGDDAETLTITRTGGEVFVEDGAGERVFGYFELWFSWVVHHQSDGVVLEVK